MAKLSMRVSSNEAPDACELWDLANEVFNRKEIISACLAGCASTLGCARMLEIDLLSWEKMLPSEGLERFENDLLNLANNPPFEDSALHPPFEDSALSQGSEDKASSIDVSLSSASLLGVWESLVALLLSLCGVGEASLSVMSLLSFGVVGDASELATTDQRPLLTRVLLLLR
jgi:hypothetical protein